ncbi:MAG: hypothetical protein AAFP78_10535 [Pseudomonadota bacterium]
MRVSPLFLASFLASPAAAETTRPDLLCGGAEPFWSLEIGETEALFSTPERPQLDYAIPDDRAALGRAWPRALTLTAPQDTAIAILRPAACSDTMSDRAFDWTIDLLTQKAGEAVIYTGCCRVAPE